MKINFLSFDENTCSQNSKQLSQPNSTSTQVGIDKVIKKRGKKGRRPPQKNGEKKEDDLKKIKMEDDLKKNQICH